MGEDKKKTVTELIKKEINIKKASGYPDKDKVANVSVEQVIKIAKSKQKDIHHNSFKSVVKSVAGSCNSLGVLIEGVQSKDFCKMVDEGKFDKEIENQIVDIPVEKKEILKEDLKTYQESMKTDLAAIKKKQEKIAEKKGEGDKVAEGEGGEKKEPSADADAKKEDKKDSKKK